MNLHPKISVIMTVYNNEPFIRESINSILNQTFTDFEFIIVNDAGSDASASIVSEFKDERIVFLNNDKNIGQTKSLNRGIAHAKGRYIARIDADDIAYPERLQEQYNCLERERTLAVVGSWYEEIDEKGKRIRTVKVPVDPNEIKLYLFSHGALTYYCIAHPSVLIRKSALVEMGGYRERYFFCQDYDLWVRLSRKYSLTNIAKPLLKYRVFKNSASRVQIDKVNKESDEIITSNIRYYLPNITEKNCNRLKKMLKFECQDSHADNREILRLFNEFFEVVVTENNKQTEIQKIKNRIMMYYLPQIFIINKSLAIKSASRIIYKYPSILKDMKLYRKIIKSFCIWLSQRKKNSYMNRIFPVWFTEAYKNR